MNANGFEQVYVGTAGWSYDDWRGIVYPPQMPRSQHPLEYLAAFFDAVEVNATFYRPPAARTCASWIRKVAGAPRFRFTAKLWRRFTHDRAAWPSDAEAQQVRDGLEPLVEAGRFGALLVQFPWSFRRTPENRVWLARVFEAFADYPLALEIRHASWNQPEVFAGLAERRVAFCNIDQPVIGASIAPSDRVTARVGYVRLHGRNYDDWFRNDAGRNDRYDYLYNDGELEPWIAKIERMRNQAGEVYVITNNHYRGQAVVNAFELQAGLGKTQFVLPPHLVAMYPRLQRLLTDAKESES